MIANFHAKAIGDMQRRESCAACFDNYTPSADRVGRHVQVHRLLDELDEMLADPEGRRS
jgi:hypothetical protein